MQRLEAARVNKSRNQTPGPVASDISHCRKELYHINLRTMLAAAEIDVEEAEFVPDLHGAYLIIPTAAGRIITIVLNSLDTPEEQLFTLYHEYAHLLRAGRLFGTKDFGKAHRSTIDHPDVEEEAECDRLAAELLELQGYSARNLF